MLPGVAIVVRIGDSHTVVVEDEDAAFVVNIETIIIEKRVIACLLPKNDLPCLSFVLWAYQTAGGTVYEDAPVATYT